MTGSTMTIRTARPGLAAGALGLVAGLLGLALEQPVLGVVAGILALAAGVTCLLLARRLNDQMALHALVEDELQADRILGRSGERIGGGPPVGAPGGPAGAHPAWSAAGAGPDLDRMTLGAVGSNGGEALMDRTTGLFSEDFFRVALESRIAAARRHLRPIAVVLLEVVEGLPSGEPRAVEAGLVSSVIRDTLREADTACRLRNGYFALLLEDTPENGAIWTVERMRRQLAETRAGLTIWAGVACYPAHAFSPEEILAAAERALVAAREWRQDRIEVAVAAD